MKAPNDNDEPADVSEQEMVNDGQFLVVEPGNIAQVLEQLEKALNEERASALKRDIQKISEGLAHYRVCSTCRRYFCGMVMKMHLKNAAPEPICEDCP